MNIHLHIGSIVLDGVDLMAGERHSLRDAVARELTRMLQQPDAAAWFDRPRDVASAAGGAFPLRLRESGQSLGPQLARAVYGSLAPTTTDVGNSSRGTS